MYQQDNLFWHHKPDGVSIGHTKNMQGLPVHVVPLLMKCL